jgi:hypothetical protein
LFDLKTPGSPETPLLETMKTTLTILTLLLCSPLRAANWPDRPLLHAVRVQTPPTLDGDLSDAAWQEAPEFTDFTQHDPDDGKPATMKTSIRIVYDDKAIYFGAKMSDPQRPTALLARRDSFIDPDFLSINIDAQHDRLSGSSFTVTPANMQLDTVLYNDTSEDGTWDGVWDSAAKIVADGWVAEVRVPFSQLRFPEKEKHVWGINITRRTVRNNEWVRIVNVPKGENGFVSRFADLDGIEGIHRGRPLELVPYGVMRSDFLSRFDRSNPYLDAHKQRIDGGLDVKYGLTSSLTLTGTINPDFGQVEVDPAVVNLSQFETFFPEKRPFFTEGANLFRFGDSPARSRFNFIFPPNPFYSRRIGRSPQGSVGADYVTAPSETTILAAGKLTGKIGRGWSVGILDALTDAERARFIDGSVSGRRQVEPMTNYFIGRTTKEIGSSSRVGMMLTSVDRRLPAELSSMRDRANVFGVDGYTLLRNKSWIIDWNAISSRISGSREAIAIAQRSPARYYQRPDAGHIHYDPNRTSLTGFGGKVLVAKQTGDWRPNVQVQAYSPGFDTNDAGFLLRTDAISSSAILQYVNDRPDKRLRERRFFIGTYMNQNFDGDVFDRGVFANGRIRMPNYWDAFVDLFGSASGLDDRQTRGGPLTRRASSWTTTAGIESDSRKKVSFGTEGQLSRSGDGSNSSWLSVSFNYRPAPNLSLSISPSVSRSHDVSQYVTTISDPNATATYGARYLFSELEQHSFELGTRAEWTVHSRLSFQLYAQPFIASGDYHDIRQLARPRTRDFVPYDGNLAEPDFNFHSLRGSAVMRWEFRPGSALFVVWNENRADVAPVGNFRLRRDLRAIPNSPSQDVFLVKLSYWIPM